MLSPGATIGVLGAGQLARMLALAAARLGFKTHVFGPERRGARLRCLRRAHDRALRDPEALDAFAKAVDVITYEFENVPAATAEFLQARKPVRPNPRALALTQDRLVEKEFVQSLRHRDRALRGCVRRWRARPRRGEARTPVDPEDAPLRL